MNEERTRETPQSVNFVQSSKLKRKYFISILRKAHDPNIGKTIFQEEFKDTTGVIRILKSKDRQHNRQKEKIIN